MRSVCARKASRITPSPFGGGVVAAHGRTTPRLAQRGATPGTDAATAMMTTACSTSTICFGTIAFTASPPCEIVAKSSAASTTPSGMVAPDERDGDAEESGAAAKAFLVVVLVAEHEVESADARRARRRSPSRATTRSSPSRRRTPPPRGCRPAARSSKPRARAEEIPPRDQRGEQSPGTITTFAAEPWNAATKSESRGSAPAWISGVCSVSGDLEVRRP